MVYTPSNQVARVTSSLQIISLANAALGQGGGNLNYVSRPGSFTAQVLGNKGPCPGAFTAQAAPGTDVNLSNLTSMGGLGRIYNLDLNNFITMGIFDPVLHKFYPLFEVLPGETYPFRLSRRLGTEFGSGAGTGTDIVGSGDTWRIVASNAPCNVLIEAFDP